MDRFKPRNHLNVVQCPDVCVSCVYLEDSNPADTGVQWGSHSQSWGPTTAAIARPRRQKPCRSEAREVTSRGGGGSWLAPSLREARRSSPAAGGRCSLSSTSSARFGSLEGAGLASVGPAPSPDHPRRPPSQSGTRRNGIWYGNQAWEWNSFFSGFLFC